METKSLERLMQLHPAIRQDAIDAYNEAVRKTPKGVHPFITETLRSFERSDALFKQPHDGKDNDGDGKIDEADEHVTNAPGGSSYHNYGLALDFVILVNDKQQWVEDKNWMIVVDCFKKRGFTWGGDWTGKFRDAPHLEKRFGYNWRTLLALHNAKHVDENGYIILKQPS
jgi:peptidoglycan L-alanyl-D-glutamate endopeptidase CwlK